MRDLSCLVWCAVVDLFRSRVALQAEILVLRHQLNLLRRKSPRRVTLGNIERVVLNRALSPGTGRIENHHSGNGDPLASHRFSSLLALEITTAWRSAKDISRDSPACSGDEPCQSVLGCTADPRRVTQTRYRCRPDNGGEIHGDARRRGRVPIHLNKPSQKAMVEWQTVA
jgi:hypothetical protein